MKLFDSNEFSIKTKISLGSKTLPQPKSELLFSQLDSRSTRQANNLSIAQ